MDLAAHPCLIACWGQLGNDLAAEVGGHDDDGVAEVDCTALTVRQPPVVEHLKKHVEYVAVGLFDLIEQDHRIGPAPDGFGEPPPSS